MKLTLFGVSLISLISYTLAVPLVHMCTDCLGATCNRFDDCSDDLICTNNVCSLETLEECVEPTLEPTPCDEELVQENIPVEPILEPCTDPNVTCDRPSI